LFSASRLVFIAFLPVLLGHLPFDPEFRFQNVVIFGDSYSDTGNLYKLSHGTWPVPPYYHGRYCNGPNWVDQLKGSWLNQLKGLWVKSYAYGGATTDNNFVPGSGKFGTVPVPGVRQQVGIYLNDVPLNKINFDRTLYILWAGGNDFADKPTLSPPAIVASLMNSVRDLLAVGAKHILVFNSVPAQSVPASHGFAPPAVLSYLTGLSNTALTADLALIQQNNTQASLNIFDINSLVSKIVASNSSYFTNTTANCWNSVNATTIIQLCSNPEKYVFVDLQHFTNRVDGLIANAVRQFFLTSFAVNSAGCYVLPA
jgi:outer membrane lipase/esterase